jgi:hypothetical protein
VTRAPHPGAPFRLPGHLLDACLRSSVLVFSLNQYVVEQGAVGNSQSCPRGRAGVGGGQPPHRRPSTPLWCGWGGCPRRALKGDNPIYAECWHEASCRARMMTIALVGCCPEHCMRPRGSSFHPTTPVSFFLQHSFQGKGPAASTRTAAANALDAACAGAHFDCGAEGLRCPKDPAHSSSPDEPTAEYNGAREAATRLPGLEVATVRRRCTCSLVSEPLAPEKSFSGGTGNERL